MLGQTAFIAEEFFLMCTLNPLPCAFNSVVVVLLEGQERSERTIFHSWRSGGGIKYVL